MTINKAKKVREGNEMKYYIKKDDYYLTGLFPVKFSLIESNDNLDQAYCYRMKQIAKDIANQLNAIVFSVIDHA